ncbi:MULTISPECIES: type I polyketide synthase [Protofrankia]|uniref:6-deoxyerythronolide-B synthase., 8-amino-7-oxononanoate synthase n=1 Tax=Candidatus Protofrankia datiscae TaxID=2716812 RepID=F8B5B8_9ACTN|nr:MULTISPECIES: type I polyketide synthase [Protofrankia]AEH07970.1 6-deoxyerythronolide-B synthase., 8-amino-7-oxononanoate synthase [Candidatus Protofrankia datiscae]
MTDVAIVGLSARFPGAASLGEFWRLIQEADPQFHEVPDSRWIHRTFYDPLNPRSPHRAYTDRVAFVDDVDRFAAAHYRIPPRRARAMDPQQRLLVHLAREALQDAGLERRPFDRARTGVYVGISQSDYRELAGARVRASLLANGSLHGGEADPDLLAAVERAADAGIAPLQAYTLTGCLLNMAAGTISSVFDLGGPAFAIDSACSSVPVALHEAVLALRTGVCRVALVGGVFLNLTPDALISFSRVGALSPSGVCRPFDERADGFVLGEGGGVAVLRPLADALADGDRVYAVIRGIGITNDGRAAGPMTPSVHGQLAALRAAYADAGVAPGTVTVIEAHGTGTTVGDRTEIAALRDLRAGDPTAEPCDLLSTKALIGHTLAAAGAASLVKMALALYHGVVPPQPETRPDPALPLAEAGLRVPTRPRMWTDTEERPRRGAISSFGFGGTNVHVILDRARRRADGPARSDTPPRRPWLLLLSASSVELLASHAEAVRDTVEADPTITPAALSHTLATRELLPARLSLVAASRAQLCRQLTEAAARLRAGRLGELPDGGYATSAPLPEADRRSALMFPGQGAQRPGMLADLYGRFAGFAARADASDGVLRPLLGRSLADLVWDPHPDADQRAAEAAETAETALTATEICQPVLGALGIAVGELLTHCGLRPDVCVGHSVGELPAAVTAGAVDPADALRFLAERGAAVAGAQPAWHGGMLAVHTGETTFHRLAAGIDGVWLGCVNHPSQLVASGRLDALERLCERAAAEGITTRQLRVSHAFHSPLVAEADARMANTLAALPIQAPKTIIASSVSGHRCDDPRELRALWARHCSAPVRFMDAVRDAAAAGARIFVQAFGGDSLLSMAHRSLAGSVQARYVALTASQPDDGRTLLAGLGQLACLGVPLDILPLFGPGERELVTLPPSPLATSAYSIRINAAGSPAGPARPYSEPATAPARRGTGSVAVPGQRGTGPDAPTADDQAVGDATASTGSAGAGSTGNEPVRMAPAATQRRVGGAGNLVAAYRPAPDGERAAARPRRGEVPLSASRDANTIAYSPESHMDNVIRLLDKQLDLLRTLSGPAAGAPRTSVSLSEAATPRQPAPDVPAAAGDTGALPQSLVPPGGHDPAASLVPTTVVVAPARGRDVLRAQVIEAISGLSAYPESHIHEDHAFVGDLGFDSIMMTDLVNALGRRWPGLTVRTEDIAGITTVGDLVTVLARRAGSAGLLPETAGPPARGSSETAGSDQAGLGTGIGAGIGAGIDARPRNSHGPAAQPHPRGTGNGLLDTAGNGAGHHRTDGSRAHPGPDSAATDVTSFPEVVALRERHELGGRLGLRSPYFLLHEGNVRDRTVVAGRELVSFSTYNYLGLSGHSEVNAAVSESVDRYGSSVSAARILSGDRPPHRELEAELATLIGVEDCVVLVSGHATNVTTIGHLVGPDDLIVHDALAHDSILQGARLSGATRRPFPHNDVAALDGLLAQVRHRFRRVLIVVEGVYSMDGDIADLPELIQVRNRHGALLMVDEAHSIGVIGAAGGGVGEHFDVDRGGVDVWMGTLSKSLASCGGYVAGRRALVGYLRYTLPGFVYSAGLTPPNTAAALAALRVMRGEPARLARLRDNSALFLRLAREAGLNTGTSAGTPIIPCIVGDSIRSVQLANTLFERGISVNPIMYPAVEERLSRLRFFITSEHTPEQIAWTVETLAGELNTAVSSQLVDAG